MGKAGGGTVRFPKGTYRAEPGRASVTTDRSSQLGKLSSADATYAVTSEHFQSPLACAGRLGDCRNDRPQAILDLLLHQTFVAAFDLETAFLHELQCDSFGFFDSSFLDQL